MSLTLMYITNNPITAEIAQKAGVDRVWIDMEYIGKEQRQGGMDTVQNRHSVSDVARLRPIVTTSELMARVNPIHDKSDLYESSEEEIESTIHAGADVVMLPYFKTKAEVERFISYVAGRATTSLLVETAEAVANIDEILSVNGIDEIHIGLNDLHLAYRQKFMFELLCDGTVERLCRIFQERGYKYGFGGVARVGMGMLPAEYIIAEHYRLGSTAAILSRGFCDANRVKDPREVENVFIEGVKNIRLKEKEVAEYTEEEYAKNLENIRQIVRKIVNA